MLETLQAQLAAAQTDKERLAICLKLVNYLLITNHTLLPKYLSEGLQLAEKNRHAVYKALFLLNQVILYKFLMRTKEQFESLLSLIACIKDIKNLGMYYYLLVAILVYLPTTIKNTHINKNIIAYAFKSIDFFAQNELTQELAEIGINFKTVLYQWVFLVYLQIGEHDKAVSALHLSTHFVDRAANSLEQREIDLRWAFYYWKTKQIELCLEQCERVLQNHPYPDAVFYAGDVQMYSIQGKIYANKYQNYPKALYYYEQALAIAQYFKFDVLTAQIYQDMFEVYRKQENYPKACEIAEKSLALHTVFNQKHSNQYTELVQNLIQQQAKNQPIFQFVFEHKELSITPITQDWDSFAWYDFVGQHCHLSGLGVEDIAKQFNMSSRTLSRRMRLVFGMSTQHFILFVRMERARQLILQTSQKISEIAAAVGIENLSYFGRMFKKQFGQLPSDFKLAHKT
jgi:AraC-like DNA-binding protein